MRLVKVKKGSSSLVYFGMLTASVRFVSAQ